MKKLFLGIMLLGLIIVAPIPTMAMGRVDVGVSIPLPPPIVFAAPPVLVVIPETYVYAVPDINVDVFFYNGWWWRPWQDRWYRSQHYGSGWAHYQSVPSFYREVPSGWRDHYRERRWKGHQWEYQRVPYQQVQRNWNNWEKNRHWEKQNNWGVRDLKPATPYRQQNREMQQPQHRDIQPQHRDIQPQRREVQPQNTDIKPQSREIRPQHSQPQYRKAPQQHNSRYEKPVKGKKEAKPQQYGPQSKDIRQQHSQPQQYNSRHGKPESRE